MSVEAGERGVETLAGVVLDADEGARQVLEVDLRALAPQLGGQRLACGVAGPGGLVVG
jgi:hypothetical protein